MVCKKVGEKYYSLLPGGFPPMKHLSSHLKAKGQDVLLSTCIFTKENTDGIT